MFSKSNLIAGRTIPLAVSLLIISLFSNAATKPVRPRILGVAHMALFVSDLEKARAFYETFLGYEEPYVLKGEDGSVRVAFIKINESQYLEIFTDSPKLEGHLNHIAFLTDSAEGMRAYLAFRGVSVPDKVTKGRIGNLNFNVTDPDGHTVEIVEYQPDSWTTRERGRSFRMIASRRASAIWESWLARSIRHSSSIVTSSASASSGEARGRRGC